MTRNITIRTAVVAASVVVVGIAAVGVASAHFTAGGSGSGSADTGTTQSVTISAATPDTQLFPGGVSDVALQIDNPNPGPVRVELLSLDPSQGTGGFAVDAAHSGCDLTALGFAAQTNGGAGWDLPGAGSVTLTLPEALSMDDDAVNACQGASFIVYLRAGA